ncbi:MAG: hypothetical protein OMM_01463 [Candidatus Magnetoglobus multicellularis str. Araruama]|uniref:VWFA domain-containing protein n=1 Tax=Candidatus Magnetoglobus multicellularis str. Araruama TaxID=890399 RepID=A0A1V1PD28_9BACT|nr:MAG: hypothetical protein OMM_01463 [Candidatus Magnetoglobus multicellularis str. Araruama]
MKQTIITNIVLFLLLIAASASAQSHEDFPEILPTYDIGTACAETGYVKVLAYVSDHNNLRFQLLSKELDENKHFIQFKQSPLQSVPEFHLKIHTLHFYQAMIIAYNTSGDIHAVSYMAAIVASRFMNSEVPTNPLPAPIVQTKKSRSGGLEMISTIDYSKFDLELIEINAEIHYNSYKVEDLDKSNFEVMENTRYQNIIKVVSDDDDYIKTADIVFVHDDSGSMSDERDAVKANIMSFVQRLQNEGIDYRIALVPYGGGGSSNSFSDPDGTILHEGTFHKNTHDFENDLTQMKIDGGTEQAFCAINQAISQLHWRESTQRFIILITDEHNNDCGVYQTQLLDKLKNTNTTCYCLYDTNCSVTDCENSSADFDPLANQTNGKIYNIYAEFTDILNDISADIASKYLIQYKTDDPESIAPREVQLKVSAYNTTKTNTMHYTANPFIISRTPETIALSDSGQRQQRSLQIVIKMTQSNAALNAALYYKNENSNFQSIQMTSIGNDLYCAYIPESMVLPKSIQYYISASNGTTTKTLPTSDAHDNPFIIPVLPNMAPFITHQSVTTANVGNSVNIKGSVEDVTNRVARVELYYKEQGENVYDQLIDTPNSTQHTFNFSIPAEKVTCNGIAYYINALDDFGVRSEIGTADNPNLVEVPPCIPPGCQDIGNVKICAEKFQGIDANNYIASGSVCIGTTSNGEILGTGAALKLNTADKTVETVIGNTLDVLSVKRTQDSTNIDLIPLYYGSFIIDCTTNPPKLTYQGGRSRLKLIKDILFSFPTSTGNNYLLIQDDAVQLKDVSTKVTEGMEASVEIGDIILSQTGNTTPVVKVSGKTLTNKRSINNLDWELKNLSFKVDIANNQFNGSGEFTIPTMIESDRGDGIPATFGFKESPLSLENIYGNLGFPTDCRQPLMIPSKHTLKFLVTNPEASDYQIVEISDSKSKKKLIR